MLQCFKYQYLAKFIYSGWKSRKLCFLHLNFFQLYVVLMHCDFFQRRTASIFTLMTRRIL